MKKIKKSLSVAFAFIMILTVMPTTISTVSAENSLVINLNEFEFNENSISIMLTGEGNIQFVSSTKNALTVNINVPSDAHSAQMSIYKNGSWDNQHGIGIPSGEYTFLGLSPDTSYDVAYHFYSIPLDDWVTEYLRGFKTQEDNGILTPQEQVMVCDINEDYQVDSGDLSAFLMNYGKTGQGISQLRADINGDGQVDSGDLAILLTNYGKSYSTEKTVLVGAQSGVVASYWPTTTTTYTVATENILSGTRIYLNDINEVGNISLQTNVISGNNTVITIQKGWQVTTGVYPLSLTIDGTTSNIFYLVVSARTAIVGFQNDILLATPSGSATFAIHTENIEDGTYTTSLWGAANWPPTDARPWGVESGNITITNNVGTLTIYKDAGTTFGIYPLAIYINNVTEFESTLTNRFYLVISEDEASIRARMWEFESPFSNPDNFVEEAEDPEPEEEEEELSISAFASDSIPIDDDPYFDISLYEYSSTDEQPNSNVMAAVNNISFVRSTTNSITVRITVPSGARSAQMSIYKNGSWDNQHGIGLSSGEYTFTGLSPYGRYDIAYHFYPIPENPSYTSEYLRDVRTQGDGTRPTSASLTYSNVTESSFNLNIVFPTANFIDSMQVYVWDPLRWQWGRLENSLSLQNGTYSITGRPQGTQSGVVMYWRENGSSVFQKRTLEVVTNLSSTAQKTAYRTDNIIFDLENKDTAFFSNVSYSTWRSWMEDNYGYYKTLTGIDPGIVIISSSRSMSTWWATADAQNGVIEWARQYVPTEAYNISTTGQMSFGMSHEISHLFDSPYWNFDGEHFANFKMAYAVEKSGRPVRHWGPNGYMNHYANSLKYFYKNNPSCGYDHAIATNTYYGDAMTYTFLNIKDHFASIGKADGGWEPFKQTFAYFNSLSFSQAPKTKLGMLNLFLSKLQDFSGVNVFSTTFLPTSARNLYESTYGGAIQYVNISKTYSAFSVGTDLYNHDHNSITKFRKATGYYNLSEYYPLYTDTGGYEDALILSTLAILNDLYPNRLNPATNFAYNMDLIGYSQFLHKLNNRNTTVASKKDEIFSAIQNSNIVYIAGHGSADGIWLNELEITNGNPTLVFHDSKEINLNCIDYAAINSAGVLSPSEIPTYNNIDMNWLIIAGCSQLNYGSQDRSWADALLRRNNAHGVLGYFGSAPGYSKQLEIVDEFAGELRKGKTFITAWKNANTGGFFGGTSNWAVIYNSVNQNDTMDIFTPNDSLPGNSRAIRGMSREESQEYIVPTSYAFSISGSDFSVINEKTTSSVEVIYDYLSIDSNIANTKTENEIRSFNYQDNSFSIEDADPLSINASEAIACVESALNKLNIMPNDYVSYVYKIIDYNLTQDGSRENEVVLEYEIVFVPAINGVHVENNETNEIVVSLSNDGITCLKYNWLELNTEQQP